MKNLSIRFWISFVVVLVSTIVSFNIGGYFWISGIGILMFLGMSIWDAISEWSDRPMSNLFQNIVLGIVVFAFSLMHVSAILGCYPSLAMVISIWVVIIMAFYEEHKRNANYNRWDEELATYRDVHTERYVERLNERSFKVDWKREGF